jgi:phage pi2 protein 07
VKKYVDRENWNEWQTPKRERASFLDPLKPTIDEWLAEDMKRTRKNRRSATKIYKDVCNDPEHSKELKVGKQTVLNYVSRRKNELYKKTYDTAMVGLHSMCEAQVDFGKVLIKQPNGTEVERSELVLSFPWSNAGPNPHARDERMPVRGAHIRAHRRRTALHLAI